MKRLAGYGAVLALAFPLATALGQVTTSQYDNLRRD
jgi:hypothetical protein